MMEYWNDGMAPFGQIYAYGGSLPLYKLTEFIYG